jgi:hypothetical protein
MTLGTHEPSDLSQPKNDSQKIPISKFNSEKNEPDIE